jgi:hypothetical protein
MDHKRLKTWAENISKALQLIPDNNQGSLTFPYHIVKRLEQEKAVESLIQSYEQVHLNDIPSFLDNCYIKWVVFYCTIQPPKEYRPNISLEKLRRPAYLMENTINDDSHKYARLITEIEKDIEDVASDSQRKKEILTIVTLCKIFVNSSNKNLKDSLKYPWIFRPAYADHNEKCENCMLSDHPVLCWSIYEYENENRIFVCKSSNSQEDNKRLREDIIKEIQNNGKFSDEISISRAFQLFLNRLFNQKGYESCLSHYVKLPVPGMSYSKGESYLALLMPPSHSIKTNTQLIARYVSSLAPVLGIIPTAIIAEISFKYAPIAGEKRETEWQLIAGSIVNSIQNIIAQPQSLIKEMSLFSSEIKKQLPDIIRHSGNFTQPVNISLNKDFINLAQCVVNSVDDISNSLELINAKLNMLMTRTFDKKPIPSKRPVDVVLETIKCFVHMGLAHQQLCKNSLSNVQFQNKTRIKIEIEIKRIDSNEIKTLDLHIPINCPEWKLYERPIIKHEQKQKMIKLTECDRLEIPNIDLQSIQALLDEYFTNYFTYGKLDTITVQWRYLEKYVEHNLEKSVKLTLFNSTEETEIERYGAGEKLFEYICKKVLGSKSFYADLENNEYKLYVKFPLT